MINQPKNKIMKTSLLTLSIGVLSIAGLHARQGSGDNGNKEIHPLSLALAVFDVNGDGVLDATEKATAEAEKSAAKAAADADKAAAKAAEKAQKAAAKATADAAKAAAKAAAEAAKVAAEAAKAAFIAKFDTNGDGVLSKAESNAAKAAIEAEREAARIAERTAQFNSLDTDASGGLSSAEFVAGVPDLSPDRAAALFSRIDADASGAISLAEFLANANVEDHKAHH